MKKILRQVRRVFLLTAFAMLSLAPLTAHAEEEEYKAEWVQEGDGWLYFAGENVVAVGWKEIAGKWYYFNADGIMQTGWVKDDGIWYFFKPCGIMATGWQKIGGKYYYFDADGVMAREEYRGGYWLTKSGAWDKCAQKAGWRHNSTGWWFYDRGWYPKNRWLWIDGKYYHFDEKGYLSTNRSIDGKYVNQNGEWPGGSLGYVFEKYDIDMFKPEGCVKKRGKKTDVTPYSYEVIPLLEPFNEWFYIMTDNPDPSTFIFRDKTTRYRSSAEGEEETGTIQVYTSVFADVVYENEETARVNGGYLAYGNGVDGGELSLCLRYYNPQKGVYDEGEESYAVEETGITVNLPRLVDVYDYLLETYTVEGADFFDNMNALQEGLDSISLYEGAYVLGNLCIIESLPYYGISNSVYLDQNFYIQEPYERTDKKYMLMSQIYPYQLTSLTFPSMLADLAWMLDENCSIVRSDYYHAYILVTCNGKTKTYGGQGHGGGQGIYEDQILYQYSFDGAKTDAARYISMKNLYRQLNEYGALEVDECWEKTIPELTWDQVKETVGDGAYVSIVKMGGLGRATGTTFSYLYDDGTRGKQSNAFVHIGQIHNAWFDGRYFDKRECYSPGTDFDETVDEVQPSLIFKDYVLPLPDDGNEYTDYEGNAFNDYDPETGIWKGYITFTYDQLSGNWIASGFAGRVFYKDADGVRRKLESEEYINAITITREEAKAMGVDRNTNVDPTDYYIYDMVTPPGTKKTN